MILITGNNGMVGTALCEKFQELGIQFFGLDKNKNEWNDEIDLLTARIDLTSDLQVNAFIGGCKAGKIDMIIHLAANARVYPIIENSDLAIENCKMTDNVYRIAKELGIKKVILASSREVYGDKLNADSIQLDETDASYHNCINQYSASKIFSEALAQVYKNLDDIDTIVCRFSNVYGRYDRSDRFVPIMIRKMLKNEDVNIYGQDKKSMDFTYLDDCIMGIIILLNNFNSVTSSSHNIILRTFNVSSGVTSKLFDIATIIKKKLKSKSKINLLENRNGEPMNYQANISKIQEFNYSPEYDIIEGITKSINYYKKLYAE